MRRILIPLPTYGFDPTETAIPWKILSGKKYTIAFATPYGSMAAADIRMLTGDGLGIWRRLLQAREDAFIAYREMEKSPAFQQPIRYSDIKETDYDALLLPGGHDKAVREYLESSVLQHHVCQFFKSDKPVAAICHGVLVAARSIDPFSGKSVIYDYKTTALLTPMERIAYQMTKAWLKDYYLTYPGMTVENEVTAYLSSPHNFYHGPLPLLRDSPMHLYRGYTVVDRNYISARWPGDVHQFTARFMDVLEKKRISRRR